MRVLTLFAPGKMAGAEKVVTVGLNGLTSLREEVGQDLVLIQEKSKPEYADEFAKGIKNQSIIKKIKTSKAIDFSLYLKVRKEINDKGPQIIHTHGYKALISLFIAKFLFFKSFKTIHTHHGNTGHTSKVRLYESVAMFLMKFCDRVISVSPKMTKELSDKGLKNIVEISNMYSLDKDLKRTELPNFEKESFHLLYLGRLSNEKNPRTLLKAAKNLLKKGLNLTLHMVGDGPLLESLKNEFQSVESIYFYGHQSEVHNFIQNSSYLCLPSLTEGMPMTVIESLCLGTPVIANNVGALPYMCHEKNSFLINLDNFKNPDKTINFQSLNLKWEEVLEEALETNKKAYCLAHKQEEIDKYSIESWVSKTEKLYKEIL